MNHAKVSVIVPVFNLENYIGRCIESIINQTLSNIEIIIINDGSSDKSNEIICSYSRKDKRIIHLSQENQGVSVARNKGVRRASGDYITFVDGDDYLELTMLEEMLKLAYTSKYDIVFCNFTKYKSKSVYPAGKNTSYHNYIKNMLQDKYPPSACGGLFRSDYIKKNNLVFNKGLSYGEDILFCIELLFIHKKSVGIVKSDLYVVEERKDSATRKICPERYKDIFFLIDAMESLFLAYNEHDFYKTLLQNYFWSNIFIALNQVLYSDKEYKDKINLLRVIMNSKYPKHIEIADKISFKKRIKIYLIKNTSPFVLWILNRLIIVYRNVLKGSNV